MPQKPLPLIISLKRWREQNGFSQSDVVKVLNNAGIPVTLDSLQNWESGRRSPRAELALALADFLRQDPTAAKKAAQRLGVDGVTLTLEICLNRFSAPNPECNKMRSRVGERALGEDLMNVYSGL